MRLSATGIIWCLAVLSGFLIAVLAGIVEPSGLTLGIVLLCAACELVDSSLGMGYGTTLTPLLLLLGFEPLVLVPTILVSELLSGFSAAFFHAEVGNVNLRRGSSHLESAAILSACSLAGAYAGVELAFSISKRTLTMAISAIILAVGVYILLAGSRDISSSAGASRFRTWKIVLLGVTASFNKALSGGGYGPLMTSGQVMSGVEGRAAVAITSLAEAFTCLTAASLFLLRGNALVLGLLIPVLTGALLAVPLSAQIVRQVPERAFTRIIAGLTITLGLFSLLRAILH